MIKSQLPIPIYQLALLQAYLYEIFSSEKECQKNFKYTEWYLNENFHQDEIEKIIDFFNKEGLSCDCGIIKKLDLRAYSNGILNFHK